MDFNDRIAAYRAIEAHRGRPLIAYVTSTRQGVGARMAGDVLREFVDQVQALPVDCASVDLLLHSAGGDGLAAWRIITLLREHVGQVHVLVPFQAFSAATLLSLGADTIYMHPNAALGPIDPQIQVRDAQGRGTDFGYEDIASYLRFVEEDAALTEQKHLQAAFQALAGVVNPLVLGKAKRASSLSVTLGARLLQTHMTKPDEKMQAEEIARKLNKSFFSHGHTLSRTEAKSLGLKIADVDKPLDGLLWRAFQGIEAFLELRKPFDPIQHYLAAGGGALLNPPPSVQLPAGLPPQVAQAVLQSILPQLVAAAAPTQSPTVRAEIVVGAVEGPRLASEYRQHLVITAARTPTQEVQAAMVVEKGGWANVPIPPVAG